MIYCKNKHVHEKLHLTFYKDTFHLQNVLKLFFLITGLFVFTQSFAQTDILSIGLGGGMNSYGTFRGELYVKGYFNILDRHAEWKGGVSNRSYSFDYENVTGLEATSWSLNGDVAVFPGTSGYFIGARWELINFNRLTDVSFSRLETEGGIAPPSLYTGTALLLQTGYLFQVSKTLRFRLTGHAGIHQVKITGFDNNQNPFIYEIFPFVANITLSMELKI
ncbi:MAG: hypothetical protein OEW75_07145 [Cyclobacteriaceae bacterium]|nr:hypothetical protein [Cyclobacteriaceae bacterium]